MSTVGNVTTSNDQFEVCVMVLGVMRVRCACAAVHVSESCVRRGTSADQRSGSQWMLRYRPTVNPWFHVLLLAAWPVRPVPVKAT